MTAPEHFSTLADRIGPQPWMQLRNVASESADAVAKSYDPADGTAKDELVQSCQTHWTNNTPMDQWVYGMVTRRGAQVTLQCRSRAYLLVSHAVEIGDGVFAANQLKEVSRFGIGADVGLGGQLATGTSYGIAEVRENSGTVPLLPDTTGWFKVAPGEKFNARAEVRFKSDNWENTTIDGGDSTAESKFITGELQIDLFAVPALSQTVAPAVVTVPGGGGGTVSDCGVDALFDLLSPVVDLGDTILAYVTSAASGIPVVGPQFDGWDLLHSRSLADGTGFSIFSLLVDEDTPDHFEFETPEGVENIISLIPISGALPVRDGEDNLLWSLASRITGQRLWGEHTAPSLNIPGQGLLIGNFIGLDGLLPGGFTQGLPDGFTLLTSILCDSSAFILGFLQNPSLPTLDWPFDLGGLPDLASLFSFTTLIPGLPLT